MTMTDPIADMLTRLRNANQAFHDSTSMPHSKIKVGIAEILKVEGYISDFEVTEPGEGEVGKTLTLTLKYGDDRKRSLAGIRRISKPGLRVYAKSNALPKVPGWDGYRHHLHLAGPDDRQPGTCQVRGRRSPRLRLVIRRD